MIEFYSDIRHAHIAAVVASAAWLALRAAGLFAGMGWPRSLLARLVSWGIDGLLLTVAAMLLAILPPVHFANHWLTVKLLLVAVYFGCGYPALGAARKPRTRALLLGLALAAWVLAWGIARNHHPLGWLAGG